MKWPATTPPRENSFELLNWLTIAQVMVNSMHDIKLIIAMVIDNVRSVHFRPIIVWEVPVLKKHNNTPLQYNLDVCLAALQVLKYNSQPEEVFGTVGQHLRLTLNLIL